MCFYIRMKVDSKYIIYFITNEINSHFLYEIFAEIS